MTTTTNSRPRFGGALGVRRARGEEGLSVAMSKNGSPRPGNHVIVLFGATGDLARRKLLPGLFHLFVAGLLPDEFRVIGSAPPEFAISDAEFRQECEQAAGEDLAEVLSYAATSTDVDYAKYFAYAGLKLTATTQDAAGAYLGVNTHFEEVPPNAAAAPGAVPRAS